MLKYLNVIFYTSLLLCGAHFLMDKKTEVTSQKQINYQQEQEIRNLYYQLNQCRTLINNQ